jgi:hypothetical protein
MISDEHEDNTGKDADAHGMDDAPAVYVEEAPMISDDDVDGAPAVYAEEAPMISRIEVEMISSDIGEQEVPDSDCISEKRLLIWKPTIHQKHVVRRLPVPAEMVMIPATTGPRSIPVSVSKRLPEHPMSVSKRLPMHPVSVSTRLPLPH